MAMKPKARPMTMLDLIQRAQLRARTDEEVIAIVIRLVNTRRVQLRGSFAGRLIPVPHVV